jgi:hypothetical protein
VMDEKLSVANFRNELEESIVARGWMYFQNGWVKPPREIMPGFFEVVVEEVNPHAISYSYDNEFFDDVFCSCGELECRHLAAVLCWYEAKLEDATEEMN